MQDRNSTVNSQYTHCLLIHHLLLIPRYPCHSCNPMWPRAGSQVISQAQRQKVSDCDTSFQKTERLVKKQTAILL